MSIVPALRWKRTLRTASSERLLALHGEQDAVAVDLHFLADGSVAGTVSVLANSGITQKDLPELLDRIDDDFLPGVDLDDGGVTFTVVWATGAESFESARQS